MVSHGYFSFLHHKLQTNQQKSNKSQNSNPIPFSFCVIFISMIQLTLRARATYFYPPTYQNVLRYFWNFGSFIWCDFGSFITEGTKKAKTKMAKYFVLKISFEKYGNEKCSESNHVPTTLFQICCNYMISMKVLL